MGRRSDSFTETPANRLTSFKNNHVSTKQKTQNTAENKHGRRYGYSSQNQFPNKAGNRSCGRDNDPPAKGLLHIGENYARYRCRVTYPIVTPTAHTRGKSPDAWALFVESVSSPTIPLTTPMFPLSKPAMQRLLEGSATVALWWEPSGTWLRDH